MSTLHKTIIFLYLGLTTCVNRVYPIKFEIKDITYTARSSIHCGLIGVISSKVLWSHP
jgi:hypothetical protein